MKQQGLILVPIDFTLVSDSAVEYAKKLSIILSAELVLLHVVGKEKEIEEANNKLKVVAQKLNTEGFKTNFTVAVGSIFDEIGKVADDQKAALIVMGTHGVIGIQHIIGSKALKVITNSNVPFIVVQKKPLAEQGFKNILIPLNFNQEVKQSINYAWEIGKYFKSKITIAYVKEEDEFIAQKINRNIDYSKDLLDEKGIQYEIIGIDKKDFTKKVLKFSNENNIDLITLINNHENIFTYFGGSFEQTVIGNEFQIPALVINAIHLRAAYSFSIYFG